MLPQPQLTSELINAAFEDNRATSGGAIFNAGLGYCHPGDDCFRLIVFNATLSDNSARGGGGGGLFWLHQNTTAILCSSVATQTEWVSLMQVGQFARLGMAKRYPRPLQACSSDWEGNTAKDGGYGPDVASSPFTLDPTTRVVPYYASNSPLALDVRVLDYYGQVASGTRTAANQVMVMASAADASMRMQVLLLSHNGIAAFKALQLRTRAGMQRISFTATSPLRMLAQAPVLVQVRPCTVGEYLAPTEDQCLPCDAGTFNTNPRAKACAACPVHADCSFPSLVVPQDGYWHTNPFSDQVHKCGSSSACVRPGRSERLALLQRGLFENADALLERHFASQAGTMANAAGPPNGGDEPLTVTQRAVLLVYTEERWLVAVGATGSLVQVYASVQCADGYEGNLCTKCADGYGTSKGHKCERCRSVAFNTTYYVLMSILTLGGLALTLQASMRRLKRAEELLAADPAASPPQAPLEEDVEWTDAVCLKIFFSYLQVVSMLKHVPLQYPTATVSSFLDFLSSVNRVPGTLVSLDCSIPKSIGSLNQETIKLIVAVASPAYVSAAACLAWAAVWWCRSSSNKVSERACERGSDRVCYDFPPPLLPTD